MNFYYLLSDNKGKAHAFPRIVGDWDGGLSRTEYEAVARGTRPEDDRAVVRELSRVRQFHAETGYAGGLEQRN
jgi:hypothetical protein